MNKHEQLADWLMQFFYEGMLQAGTPKEHHTAMLLAFAKGMESICRSMHASPDVLDLEQMADAAFKCAAHFGSKKKKK